MLVMMTRHREREREREREMGSTQEKIGYNENGQGFLSQEDSVGVIECLYYILT